MIKDPESTISQPQQEKTQNRETTVEVIQKGETNSTKHEKSDESDESVHSYAEECSSFAKTEMKQTSSTTFGTDGVEGELNHERNTEEDNSVNDQSTIPLKDETIRQSGINEDKNEQNEIKLEPELEDGNQIQRSSVEPSTITIIQNEQVCDDPRRADVVEDAEIAREEDNILKDITSVRIGEETTDASTAEDKKESWKADGEVCGDLEYTEKEIIQDSIVEENSINTVGDETVTENSHKDEKVSVSLDVAGPSTEIDEHGTNGNDFVMDHSTMCDGDTAAKQSYQEDDDEKPVKEVSGEIESFVTSNDTREKIMEDDIFPEPFAASTDDVDISSHEEEVHVNLEPAIQDEAVEENTLQELSTEGPRTVSIENLTTKESSHEAEVQEELKTDVAEEDGGNHTMEDGTGTKIPMVSVIERTPEVISQEEEKVAKIPRAEVVESDLEPTEGGNHYPKITEIVSLEEDLKKSLIDHGTTEALDELKTDSAGDDAANQTMDIHVVSEEKTKGSSQEDRKEVKPPGGKAEESDLLSIQGGADFVKETEEVSLEEEEDQRKSLVNFRTRVAPSEEIIKMESNDKLLYTSINSSTSDEQVIDASQMKTENTSNIHGSNSVTLLQEELSLHEAKTGEKIVDESNLPSKEIFSTPIEESQDAVVEDVKHDESSNLAQNATQDTFPTENPEADEAKQEKSEILVEVSAVETQLVHQDIETTTVSDKISNEPSSNDIAEEMPQESFMLETDKPMLDTFKMKEDINNKCLVDDEMMDKKTEAPSLAQTKGEIGIEKEDHINLKQDSEVETENFEPKSSIPEIDQENLISKPKDAAVILEKEKFMKLNEFRKGSESSDPGLKQSILEDEEKFTVPCGNMERDVQEEDHIKKLDKTLGESKKEFMKVEKMLVEVQAADHSHQINDSYHTIENVSFLQQKLKAVDPCGEVTKATEAIDNDLSHEALSEIEMVKDRENRKDQDAIPVEDHKVDQNIQEEDSDKRDLEEAGPKSDVEDQNDCMNNVNQPMTETNVKEELPRGVEIVDESENVEKQIIEEEAACVEVSTDDTLVKEVKDSDSVSAERTTETTDSNEVTETRTSTHMEDQNNSNSGTDASKEEVSKVVSKVSEDNMEKEAKEEGDDTNNELQISPTIMVTEETSIMKAENEAEKIVDVFHTSTEVENSKMDETIDTCIKGDDNDKTNLEKTSYMVSQLHTDEYENKDQKSVIVEKNINDILERDIPARNTEESSEEDKQSVEPIIPDENIKAAEVDNINTTHSSAENISMGESGEQHKEKSEFESSMDKEVVQSDSEDQIPERLVEVDKVEDTDTTIIDVGRVKDTFQKDKQGEYIEEANCEYEAEDDTSKRTIEASESKENETITEEFPEQPENASATENNERQDLGKEQSVNHSGQVTYDEKSTKGSHEEDERKKDDVKQEVIILVDEDQISERNAEKDQGEDAFESKAPKTEILNEEMMKGGHVTDQISVREVSVQENNHGEETKEAEVEEQYPTLVPEKLQDESKHVRDEEGKTNETTEEEVNQMINSSDLVLVAQDISQAAEKTKTVDVEDKEGERWKLDDVPVKIAPSQEAPNELIHESITRYLERKESEAEVATDSENFVELKQTSSSDFDTMSTAKELHIKEDLPTDVLDASSVVKASQEEIQEKESEEKQEVVFVKKATMEPNIPTEDNRKNIEHQAPVPEITNESVEKINDHNIQEKLGVNEEGLLPLLKQDETPQDFKILDKSSDVIDENKISEGNNNIAEKEEDISIKSIVVPSVPAGLMGSYLHTAEDEEGTQGEAQRNDLEVIEVDCEAEEKMQNLDEETKLDSESSATKGAQLFDLLIISRKDAEQADGKEELEHKEALTVKEEHKTNEREADEEGEEEDEHKKEDSGSDAPVMVEASRDIDVKQTPTKKSHSILSGVGSKVKHSISKVKKAITGKSSHHKQMPPK
ncbi:titin [Thalictrum thalictroides]|uniref:Titin n=1 Tax=Thalictrum thalictroides TaxID=46969 RepID=A0A7J6UVA0_THATH|nr:titin [Thalictrum thalictroides]